jgi:hypothetical protein
MDRTAELTLVVIILCLTGAAIPVIALLRDEYLYRGYQELRSELRALASELKGQVTRRGDDLIVSGIHSGFPVELCVSKSDYTPALAIKLLTAPLLFNIRIKPRTDKQAEKGSRLAMSDAYLNERFAAYADGPETELAGFLVDGTAARKELRRLCWSGRNYVFVTPQHVELLEPKLADSAFVAHCLDVVGGVARLAILAQELVGKAGNRPTVRRQRYLLRRAATGIAAAVALVALWAAGGSPAPAWIRTSIRTPAQGVFPQDASHISGVANWRVAGAEDFDPFTINWFRQHGQRPSGRLLGDFSGAANGRDVAYVLKRADGSFRVVMLIRDSVAYDGTFSKLQFAAVIPKDRFSSLRWVDAPPASPPSGDGLLIVMRDYGEPSALVLYREAGVLHSARAADYESIQLN